MKHVPTEARMVLFPARCLPNKLTKFSIQFDLGTGNQPHGNRSLNFGAIGPAY